MHTESIFWLLICLEFVLGLTSESDGLIANLRRQFHCVQGSVFRVCFNFGNFHTGCVASVGVVPKLVYDDDVFIHMELALTTAYHTSSKPLRTLSRKSMKSEHESSIYKLLALGSFCALHGSNLVSWLEDVLFRLVYRGLQHQKKLEREVVQHL